MRSAALILAVLTLGVAWFIGGRGGEPPTDDPAPEPSSPELPSAPRVPPNAGPRVLVADGPGDFPLLETNSKDDLRLVSSFCSTARLKDLPALRWVALEAPDSAVVSGALGAIARLGGMLDEPRILDLVGDERAMVRQNAVLALGRNGDAVAIPLLALILEGDDGGLRSLAIQAIGELGGEEARAVLEAYTPRADERELAFLRAALGR